MAKRVPVLSGYEVVRIFERLGWTLVRQGGSHMILTKSGEIASLSVPNHREVAAGTLRGLIRAANLTVDEFLAAR
jgi:predicted RNA binding protein YcfA (HicA-like mRNA interferase family)